LLQELEILHCRIHSTPLFSVLKQHKLSLDLTYTGTSSKVVRELDYVVGITIELDEDDGGADLGG
jgi:hypothetical protein